MNVKISCIVFINVSCSRPQKNGNCNGNLSDFNEYYLNKMLKERGQELLS